ncbi:TonB-dependent receptor [Aureibaculum sp. A20]|uniref:TonB-dependent receptor n=1 Tax=Aureibaculum flavum TaxID=2795986 RepID=A0ABS0WV68_9FLAO|nr:TonB-dependent receptor [Aureibaculum flavum]MBJ2175892.1 TonB-dependent receptor [Aureibaculum flavum]
MKKKLLKKLRVFLTNHVKKNMHLKLFGLMIISCSYGINATSTENNVIDNIEFDTFQQTTTITGTVLDNENNPLPGASIIEKGTTNGTTSDFDGNFSITLKDENAIVLVSFVGFTTQEITINGKSSINVVLQPDAQSLDEVIVVGYGTAKRKDITGSVERVNLEDSPIALSSNTSVLQTIRGATPGINIGTQNQVGTTPSIIVRGQNSINGNNNPLIVLDGVVFLGSVSDINPNDIASIDILKDASAAVVYGSRAGNGVIIINTKKGKTSKPVIKLSSSTGVNVWQNKPNLLSRDSYLEKYATQVGAASVDAIVWEEEYRGVLQDEGVDTDWIDLVSRKGSIQKHNLSVSGRSENVNYFFSGGYEEQEGVILGDEFNRVSLRSRVSADVTDWLELGLDGSYTNSDYSGVTPDVGRAMVMAPIGYPYRYDGQPFNTASNTSTALERYPTANNVPSPLWGTDGTRDSFDKRNYFRLAANATVKVPWIKGLKYTFNYSLSGQYRSVDNFYYEDYYIGLPTEGTPYYDRYSQTAIQANLSQANGSNARYKDYNYVMDNIINYNNSFGKHNVDVTLVATRDYRKTDQSVLDGNDFAALGNTSLGVNGITFATTQTNSYDLSERSNVGYLGRLSYGFDNKYNLTAAVRRDGASVFGSEKRFGTFWSVGGAWTLSNENFLRDNKILNYLKINASYGTNGNQGLSPYQTLSGVITGVPGDIEYAFGDNPSVSQYGIEQTSLGNADLGWESTTALNFGLHSAWLNSRITLDADIYFSKTSDQIFKRNIPSTSGFTSILASLGQIDNKGVEISLGTKNVDTENFSWSSNLTYWKNSNKITELYGDDIDGDGVEDDDISNSLFIGESLGAIYGYDYIGVVQTDDTQYIADTGASPGDAMYRDLDGEPGITAAGDRKILGFSTPNFRMGFSNTFTYKNFSLYMLFTGTFGGNDYFLGSNPRSNSLQNRFDYNDVDNGAWWTPENQSTTNLGPTFNDSRYKGLQSRGFVRLQNVNLTYKFDKNMLERLGVGISSFEMYASADNPLLFTNWYGGGDPERGIAAQSGTLPIMSAYTFGINVSF